MLLKQLELKESESNENGIDFDLLADVKNKRRARLTEYAAKKATATYYEGSVWTYAEKYDIALPCATQNEINGDAAKRLVAQGVILCQHRQSGRQYADRTR